MVQDGKVLLPRLSNIEKNSGYYTLPGGGIDFGEEPDACVVREVFEETGLNVLPKRVLMTLSWTPDPEFHVIGIVYEVEVLSGDLRFEQDGTTDYLEWFPLEALETLPIVPLVRRVYERHLAGF